MTKCYKACADDCGGESCEFVQYMANAPNTHIPEVDYKALAYKLRYQLESIIGMCEHCGDFRNHNTHNGIDEGQVMYNRMMEQYKGAISDFDAEVKRD